ncbi:MAG: hypothetical protein U1E11_11760 [Dethiobacteria bacterium]|nr:hypothetical protein [Dethiobacteria bacterium]
MNNDLFGSRHLLLLSACFVIASLFLLILSGCAPPIDGVSENDNQARHTKQREEEAAMKEESGFAEISRPPIDLELPDGLKTVTLAMG